MSSKKKYGILMVGGMIISFFVAFLISTIYTTDIPQKDMHSNQENIQDSLDKQEVMTSDDVRVGPDTKVTIEILDQFGIVTQRQEYQGINWLGYTRLQIAKIFPDYKITQYGQDKVVLTKVIERDIKPNYLLTTQDGNIVISLEKNGNKLFYKDTGLGQHDLSKQLSGILEEGIGITAEQKDEILEDSNMIYVILQEYDE